MNVSYPGPVILFAILSIAAILFSKRAGGIKGILIASYCGVMITSFTGGASGGIWLSSILLFLVAIKAIGSPREEIPGKTGMLKMTRLLLLVFLIGIIIGFMRYDPAIEAAKAGSYRTFVGIPVSVLIAGYRLQTVAFLFLAIWLPLHYQIDRKLFLECLAYCCVGSLFLAILTFLHYARVGSFTYTTFEVESEIGHMGIFGFTRATEGNMLVTGIFMSFAMVQLTRSFILKILGYITMPALIAALLLSFSRTAVIALAVGIVVIMINIGGVRIIKGMFFVLLVIATIYIVMKTFPDVAERFSTLTGIFSKNQAAGDLQEISAGRVTGWLDILEWLATSPDVMLFGAGFQNFQYFVTIHSQVGYLQAGHNNFIHILTESGIGGLLIFLLWIISIFLWLFSWRRNMTDKTDRVIPKVFGAFFWGLVASCMTSETLSPYATMVPWVTHFYIILGIWISYYRTQMWKQAEYEQDYSDQTEYEIINDMADDLFLAQ